MLNATITKRIDVTADLIRLWIQPDSELPHFMPGQYVAIGLPGSAPRPASFPPEPEPCAEDKLIKRAYSIASSPDEREGLEFYIAVVPSGALTPRLAMLHEGDRIYTAQKITGTFTLDGVPAEQNLVFVSTGTGIAPFVSMLRTKSTWTPQRKITILHGVRYPRDLGYGEELRNILSTHGDSFAYYPIVSRDDGTPWHGERGHVQKFFSQGMIALDAQRDHVFLCGNPAMIADIEKSLVANCYVEHSRKRPGNLHIERYW